MNDYENFLVKLNNQTNQEIFAKITSLNFQENPVESIEGVIYVFCNAGKYVFP